MQIDFHHAVTYVTARLAGFDPDRARIIAHAAQYVDDATEDDLIKFKNGALFKRICSSHKMYSFDNMRTLDSHRTWLPFHFLPGNDGKAAETVHQGKFIDKIVCRPDSFVAQDLVRLTIQQQDRPYALHRLGVTMHVYADTWAHQGFAGVLHDINKTDHIDDLGNSGILDRMKEKILHFAEQAVPPLGHGQAFTFPDMPYLKWRYENGRGKEITRNNTEDFVEAAHRMCMAMQRYLAKDADAPVNGLSSDNRDKIKTMFEKFDDEDGDERHKKWLQAIAKGAFPELRDDPPLTYVIGENEGSWKHESLGTVDEEQRYPYPAGFLGSNWKFFHDAIQAHRFQVIHEILPKYGICAA
ncbi:MAG: hypothetical protein H7839_22435 [Magnetococcus sp. YQC-5]